MAVIETELCRVASIRPLLLQLSQERMGKFRRGSQLDLIKYGGRVDTKSEDARFFSHEPRVVGSGAS